VTWGLYNNDTPSEAQKEEFYRVAKWTAERGMALTVHWNNDRSVHHLLDVLERVAGPDDVRRAVPRVYATAGARPFICTGQLSASPKQNQTGSFNRNCRSGRSGS
jgi:hypothetical protein